MDTALEFVRGIYAETFRPRAEESIPAWALREVEMDPTSPIPGPYRIANSPQLAEPLEVWQDDSIRHQITIGPNQGGRTKGMEIACIWTAVHRPGPMQWNTDTNDSAADFAEERFWPMAFAVAAFQGICPRKLDDMRKRKIIFRNGIPFTIQGANETNLQQKSILTQFNDEVYKWRMGMLDQAHKRCNVSYAATCKIWDASIASDEGHDMHKEWTESSRGEWSFTCRACGHAQRFKWGGRNELGGLKWDSGEQMRPGGEWDYEAMKKTVRYVCENATCGEVYADTMLSRNAMNRSATYLHAERAKRLRGHRFNILSVNHSGMFWGTWVEEFLKATEHYRTFGDVTLLKQFWTRRMGEFWEESRFANPTDGKLRSDYQLAEPNYYVAHEWPADEHGEAEWGRFMAADKQESDYPYVVRAVKKGGATRLIARGRAASYDELAEIANRFRVLSRRILIDCSFEMREVFAECSQRGWTALRGEACENFSHQVETAARGGGTKLIWVKRPYSKEEWGDPGMGKREQQRNRRGSIPQRLKMARYFRWSNLSIKNILNAMKQGRTQIYWGVPEDVGKDYIAQINSEVRYRKLTAGGVATYFWSNCGRDMKGHKKPNHYWDCECMILVALIMQGLIDLDRYTSPGEKEVDAET